jgi:hypothetical protein
LPRATRFILGSTFLVDGARRTVRIFIDICYTIAEFLVTAVATTPEIERLWTQLLHYIEEGRVVPIIGPGLLGETMAELATELANRMGVSSDKLPPGAELNTVACRHLEKGGRIDDLYSELFSISAEKPSPIAEPLLQLAQIPPLKLFVSTTFDSLLEQALARFRLTPQVLTYSLSKFDDLKASIEISSGPIVYHLFGKLVPTPDFALTDEDVLEFIHCLQSETRRPVKLYDELAKHSLLILGSRLTDWLARFFLRTPRLQRLSADQKYPSFIADPDVSADANLIVFLNYFSRKTRVFSAPAPVEFVAELYRRWKLRHPDWSDPSGVATRDQKPFVFLSYASEDETAARQIYEVLSKKKMQVFFDKKDLYAGENWEIKLRKSIRDQCSLFIPIISQNVLTQENRYFRQEWKTAHDVYYQSPAWISSLDVFFLPVAIDSTSPESDRLLDEFRKAQWSYLPEGRPTSEFIERVVELHRRYQQARAGML